MSKTYAPQTAVRPARRPDNFERVVERANGLDLPPDYGTEGTTPGMFPDLGMTDETADFSALSAGARRGEPSEVILHQTMSETGDATRNGYRGRMNGNNAKTKHVGAQYLIDEDGATSLIVPTDERVWHTQKHNDSAIGIETVGMPASVSQRSDMHAQIEALDLAPVLKERLLAMTERELKATLRANDNTIYEDISGPQKRANWNLLRALGKEYGIDMADGVDAHEDVQAKTIGEGGNTEAFVDAMLAWPDKIEALEQRITDLRSYRSPDMALLQRLVDALANEKAVYEAVKVDGTAAERNALDGEAILGEGGPATDREALRTQFWDGFYPSMERLDALIQQAPANS